MKSKFLSVKDVLEEYPFTPGGFRRLLFMRASNGLSTAVIKINRKLLIDRKALENWLRQFSEQSQS